MYTLATLSTKTDCYILYKSRLNCRVVVMNCITLCGCPNKEATQRKCVSVGQITNATAIHLCFLWFMQIRVSLLSSFLMFSNCHQKMNNDGT